MALLTAVAGPYVATYSPGASASGSGGGAAAQGITADDGFVLGWTIHKQNIGNDGTDQYGNSLLEAVIRGADWTITYLCREYSVNNMIVAWPYGKTTLGGANAALQPTMAQAGATDSGSGYTGTLVMTAMSGTPASSSPATLTSSSCIMRAGAPLQLKFTSKIREVPVSLVLYPYAVTLGGSPFKVWFVTT